MGCCSCESKEKGEILSIIGLLLELEAGVMRPTYTAQCDSEQGMAKAWDIGCLSAIIDLRASSNAPLNALLSLFGAYALDHKPHQNAEQDPYNVCSWCTIPHRL
jgi:hypothetical protein